MCILGCQMSYFFYVGKKWWFLAERWKGPKKNIGWTNKTASAEKAQRNVMLGHVTSLDMPKGQNGKGGEPRRGNYFCFSGVGSDKNEK